MSATNPLNLKLTLKHKQRLVAFAFERCRDVKADRKVDALWDSLVTTVIETFTEPKVVKDMKVLERYGHTTQLDAVKTSHGLLLPVECSTHIPVKSLYAPKTWDSAQITKWQDHETKLDTPLKVPSFVWWQETWLITRGSAYGLEKKDARYDRIAKAVARFQEATDKAIASHLTLTNVACDMIRNAKTLGQLAEVWPEVTEIRTELFPEKPASLGELITVDEKARKHFAANLRERGVKGSVLNKRGRRPKTTKEILNAN